MNLARRMAALPTGRVRVAADAAHLVAVHANRARALVVAAGAAGDVPPRRRAMELPAAARNAPTRRMRIARSLRERRQIVGAVAVFTRSWSRGSAGKEAPSQRASTGVPAEEVVAVDEVADRPARETWSRSSSRPCARVAVGAERLLVAGGAALRRRARRAWVLAHEVALVRIERHRPQLISGQIEVAHAAATLIQLLFVLVALRARSHGRSRIGRAQRLRQRLMARTSHFSFVRSMCFAWSRCITGSGDGHGAACLTSVWHMEQLPFSFCSR